jgi:relaxase-like protein
VVIKGTSCAGAPRLAAHLLRTDTNERAEVRELRGVAAEDLRGALREMEAVAAGTRTTKPFYHGSINTRADERLSDEQRTQAIDRLETALGLTGQARVVVVHEKEGREHCHIVWSRIDLEKMRAISDSHNYRKHEEVARALEREFGHERVQGAHIEREGKERPERTPSHAEMLQADRTGMSPKEAKEQITELWRRTDNGPDFAKALWDAGYVLARGDRRDFVVIDPKGGTHSLARRVEGATAKDIRARLAGLDPNRFPNVTDAKQIQRNRHERDTTRGRDTSRAPSIEPPRPAPQAYQGRSKGTPEGPSAPARIADGPGRVAASFLDGIASAIERGFSGTGEAQSDHKRDAPAPQPDPQEAQREASVHGQQEAAKQRREGLLREFGRELPHEHEADIERGRERERRGE